MVNVLYLVSTLKRTGPTNVLFNLISKLDRTQFKPIILTLSPEETDYPSSLNAFVEIGVDIHSLHLSRLKGFLLGKKKLREFILGHGIRVIHVVGFRGDLLIKAADFKDITIISTINSNIYDDYTMLYGKLRGHVMARLHIRSLKGKRGIACSQFVADELKERYGIKLHVIYNGIPKEQYGVPSSEEKTLLRKQLQLPANKKIFIFVGYLIFRKDPLTVLKGFLNAGLLADSHLVMLGDGPLMEECKLACKGYTEQITFFGNQPETLKYLKASDYYIASAYSEGLPTSVMEAMSCGLPVILSAINPHKELLSYIASWDYTFPINNNEVLSSKIDNIVKDNYSRLSKECREVIDKHVNSGVMATNYQSLYQQ